MKQLFSVRLTHYNFRQFVFTAKYALLPDENKPDSVTHHISRGQKVHGSKKNVVSITSNSTGEWSLTQGYIPAIRHIELL